MVKIERASSSPRLTMLPTGAFAVLMLCAPLACALPLQTVEPRPFGYTVGDVLERRVLVDPARDGVVDPASLPRPGRNGRWFELRRAALWPDGVHLVYQIVNAPLQPDRENLPALRLRVIGPDRRAQDADIGPFTIALTPVTQFGPNDLVQLDNIRPDLDPAPIDTSARRARVLVCALALAALAAAVVGPPLVRHLGPRRTGPFARAARALRHRPRDEDVDSRRRALRRLHQAFDEAAGRTLALDNVEQLFLTRPWLAPARGQVETLLADSRAAFFAEGSMPVHQRVAALAARLAALEAHR